MDNEIICWDIRNLGEVLMSLKRVVSTNQRIYFDLSKDDKYLMTGGLMDFSIHGIKTISVFLFIVSFMYKVEPMVTYLFGIYKKQITLSVSLSANFVPTMVVLMESGLYTY